MIWEIYNVVIGVIAIGFFPHSVFTEDDVRFWRMSFFFFIRSMDFVGRDEWMALLVCIDTFTRRPQSSRRVLGCGAFSTV